MLTLDLHGKIAVVTGATGELGRTIARTLAECGADVAIHYHQNEAQAQLLENEISLLGVRALMSPLMRPKANRSRLWLIESLIDWEFLTLSSPTRSHRSTRGAQS